MISLSKMVVDYSDCAQYRIGDLELNTLLEKKITIEFSGEFHCHGCGKEGVFRIYGDGFCGKCVKTLARCDFCMVKPELCHFHEGTCREPDWGEKHCNREHIIYLANTSGLKVGITRKAPTRWLDQGATQALPIISVGTRYHSGLVEKLLASFVADKTNWQTMLKGDGDSIDLVARRDELFESAGEGLDDLEDELGSINFLDDEKVRDFKYPVIEYPLKVTSLKLEKNNVIEGTLLGIKGQYLILDNGVFNVRKHSGYRIKMRSNI